MNGCYASVADKSLDWILNNHWPSSYRLQKVQGNRFDLIALLETKKTQGWENTVLGPVRGLARAIYWTALGFLAPLGAAKHGSIIAYRTAVWIWLKAKNSPDSAYSKEEIRKHSISFCKDFAQSVLTYASVKGVLLLALNRGYLSDRTFEQIPRFFRVSSEGIVKHSGIFKVAAAVEIIFSAASALLNASFIAFVAVSPEKLLFMRVYDVEKRILMATSLELKTRAGIVSESGHLVELSMERLYQAHADAWKNLLHSIKKACSEGHPIPYSEPLQWGAIKTYFTRHAAEFSEELFLEMEKSLSLVRDIGEMIQASQQARYQGENFLKSVVNNLRYFDRTSSGSSLQEKKVGIPDCPFVNVQEYFPRSFASPILNSGREIGKPIRPLLAVAIEALFNSSWLSPSNVQERPIRDLGAISASLNEVNLFKGRVVKGRLHRFTKPLRVIARAVYYAAATGLIAPLGFLYHLGSMLFHSVTYLSAKDLSIRKKIMDHGSAALTDGIHGFVGAYVGFLIVPMIAMALADGRFPLLKQRSWGKIGPRAGLYIGLGLMGGFQQLALALFPRGMIGFLTQSHLAGGLTKSYLLKERFGLIANRTGASLLNYVEEDSTEGLESSPIFAQRILCWTNLLRKLREQKQGALIWNSQPLKAISEHFSANPEIMELVQQCREINALYNELTQRRSFESPFRFKGFTENSSFPQSGQNNSDIGNFNNCVQVLRDLNASVEANDRLAELFGRATAEGTDPWTVLGVESGATKNEMRRAYLRISVIVHPDHNKDSKVSQELFKCVAAAYLVASK